MPEKSIGVCGHDHVRVTVWCELAIVGFSCFGRFEV
jgi:hypothetical protein